MAARFSPGSISQELVGGVSVSHLGNIFWRMYAFAQAAITTDHRLGGLNDRNLLPHSSGGEKSKIKVSAEWVSSEASLLGL